MGDVGSEMQWVMWRIGVRFRGRWLGFEHDFFQ